jgi:hypothetical protein
VYWAGISGRPEDGHSVLVTVGVPRGQLANVALTL